MNWIVLKALNKLHEDGIVKKNESLSKSEEFRFMVRSLNLIRETGKSFISNPEFNAYYEAKYLKNYSNYVEFLHAKGLLKTQTRFEESDIQILMKIHQWKNEGNLEDLRQRILALDESIRGISEMFFKNEKYLDRKDALIDALKIILEVPEFANEKEQQYIYKLECHNAKAIVLCENLDFLMKPTKPRHFGIELWYAGGKNIDKLNYADHRGLPIYYSCDWDFDGLFVIYPLVKQKLETIELLTPIGLPKSITETEHASQWHNRSHGKLELTEVHNNLIQSLIEGDQWIIEESNDFEKLMRFNGVIN